MRQLRGPNRTFCAAVAGLFLGCMSSACVTIPSARQCTSEVLYPQSSLARGPVYLQPRHARETRELVAPGLLEPGDWVETGPLGKVELQLPQAVLRLYENTRIQVSFEFNQRQAIAREIRLEYGELLLSRGNDVPLDSFTVNTPGLQVDIPKGAAIWVASDGRVHRAACYKGQAEARNVRVRGQTVIRLSGNHLLTLDDAQAMAVLEERSLKNEWRRWEQPGVQTSGILPPPVQPSSQAPGPAPPPADTSDSGTQSTPVE